MNQKPFLPCCVLIVVLSAGIIFAAELPADPFGDPAAKPPTDPFTGGTNDPELMKLKREAERKISIRQANLFHREFMSRCVDDLPLDVGFWYQGPLFTGSSRTGLRVLGEPACILEWVVHRNVVLFSLWISTVRTSQTVSKCKIEGKNIFVNVSFVDEFRSLDEAFPELGGRSIREVVSRLAHDSAASNKEQNAKPGKRSHATENDD
jgi:hypothetical protein